MTVDRSSADVVPIHPAVDDETYVYDNADEEVARRDAIAPPVRPQQIGRYLILEEIGRGGMGIVCTAYDPKLDRKVAIKLIKKQHTPGSKRAVNSQARLVREAQALAKLNHPNIVTVHDVDTTPDAQLYMAMEYVEGETLAHWLHRAERGWREILEAYDKAGRGLAAAHVANITHRDFKPSNVLVTDSGRVKVLDFGLAKNLDNPDSLDNPDNPEPDGNREPLNVKPAAALADVPVPRPRPGSDSIRRKLASSSDIMDFVGSATDLKLTQAGRIVGTPAYMAPEQHAGAGVGKVGAWTDQFSFAVSLYESLYGDLPFEGDYLDEVYWNIRKGKITDPPRDTTVPTWVFRILRKALSADPQDRYPSMDAMLASLGDDPSKKRRRVGLYAGGAALVAMGGFGVYQAVWGQSEDTTLCTGAEQRLAGVWDEGVRGAVRASLLATELPYAQDTADRVDATLQGYADQWVATRTSVCEATVRGEQSEELRDVRMICLDGRRAQLGALARVLSNADEEVAERAVSAVGGLGMLTGCETAEAAGAHSIPDDPGRRNELTAVESKLAEAKALYMTGKYQSARTLAGEARLDAESLDHGPIIARAHLVEGNALQELGNLEQARASYESAVTHAAESRAFDDEFEAWRQLVFLIGYRQGDAAVGRSLVFTATAALSRFGSTPTDKLELLHNAGSVEWQAGRFQEARDAFDEALDLSKRHLGPRSEHVARILIDLAPAEFRLGNREAASRRFEEALELYTELYGPHHPTVANAALGLGNVLASGDEQDKQAAKLHERAAQLYERALAIRRELYGDESAKAAQVLNSLGALRRRQGQYEEARSAYEKALRAFRSDDQAIPTAMTLNNLGLLAKLEGDLDAAVSRHREALEVLAGSVGATHVRSGKTSQHLCLALNARRDFTEARRACEDALTIYRDSYKKAHRDVASTLAELATIEQDLGRLDRSRQYLQQANEQYRGLGVPNPRREAGLATGRDR